MVALISGIAAKEVVVSSCSVLFGIQNITTAHGMDSFVAVLASMGFGAANAYALMVFCLLYVPCTATIATIRREVGSAKLTCGIVLFQLAVAWVMSFIAFMWPGCLCKLNNVLIQAGGPLSRRGRLLFLCLQKWL